MTVCIACNLSDGVILGVDSAVTITDATGGVAKTYEKADKLFELPKLPIGIATFGLGSILQRSVGSYLREFELQNPNGVLTNQSGIDRIVEELRSFFLTTYMNTVAVELQKELKLPFKDIPKERIPILGLVVGGYSPNSYLSQVWEILVPTHDKPNTARQHRKEGNFGSDWFAMYEPVQRYIKGFTPQLLDEVTGYFVKARKAALTKQEEQDLQTMVNKYEYQIPYWAMPISEGIEHVRFLVSTVVNHHRFALGAPIVGGKINIGLVTYKDQNFQILHGD